LSKSFENKFNFSQCDLKKNGERKYAYLVDKIEDLNSGFYFKKLIKWFFFYQTKMRYINNNDSPRTRIFIILLFKYSLKKVIYFFGIL